MSCQILANGKPTLLLVTDLQLDEMPACIESIMNIKAGSLRLVFCLTGRSDKLQLHIESLGAGCKWCHALSFICSCLLTYT